MVGEQRYRQDLLSTLLKWTLVCGPLAAVLNFLGFAYDLTLTTLIGSFGVTLFSLITWWCLRLARQGKAQLSARIYIGSGMILGAMTAFIAAKHEILIGAMALAIFIMIATFLEAPATALWWGIGGALLYEVSVLTRHLIPLFDYGFSIDVALLYTIPPVILFFCAFVGRTINVHLSRALQQSETARRELEQSHAEIERRVEERTRDLVHEQTRSNATLRELDRACSQAEAANRAKSAFLANMSHELRTPLSAILGYNQLIRIAANRQNNTTFVEELEAIQTAGNHLLSLISNILDLSKIEASKMDLNLENFDITALLTEVIAIIHPLVDQRHNTLKIELAAELGTMRADKTKVRQVLFNILSNAAKFTENGIITLRVCRTRQANQGTTSPELETPDGLIAQAQSFIVFTVSDTGIGIAPEYMPNLFQAFTQVDTSATRKYGGSGLGLAISQRFCELMGGKIQATSKAGEGSIFVIYLPAVVSDTIPAPQERFQHITSSSTIV